jgi:xanthine dehydrogenase YagS FAD-binding subunit
MAPALIALDARIHILGPIGARTLPLEDFFVTPVQRLYQENVLERSEVITALTVPPAPAETKQVFLKSRIRQADEFSLAAEEAIRGRPLTEQNIQQAAAALADARPMSMNAYKLDLTRGLVVRAFQQVV